MSSSGSKNSSQGKRILWFSEISKNDAALVGGKNASLGEMFSKLHKDGISVPNGFCLTADGYWYFLKANKIDQKLKKLFAKLNPSSIKCLKKTSRKARALILNVDFPQDLQEEIFQAYQALCRKYKRENIDVAVRSSATAEDSQKDSFAGQHETYLNVSGKWEVLKAFRKCIASLFLVRAIAYRQERGFGQTDIGLSVACQKMVRSDKASSGIMFTLDTETGFNNVILINSIYGIGEMIVKGKITPDEFYVFKPSLVDKKLKPIIVKNLGRKHKKYIYNVRGGLKQAKVSAEQALRFSLSDSEVLCLARWGAAIEKHYGCAQDIEWAKDGQTGKLFIVQSRPETVHSQNKAGVFTEYLVSTKKKPILLGTAVGSKIGFGRVNHIASVSKMAKFQKGEVLVTKMTDPDWLPAMAIASAIVTEEGGRSCHAAIVARELGVPAIVGAKGVLAVLKTGQEVTVDCTSSSVGKVFSGKVDFSTKQYKAEKPKALKTKIMLNIGAPDMAFRASFLPNDGVGLAREEFIIAEKIKVHPLALIHYNKLKQELKTKNKKLKTAIKNLELKKLIQKIDAATIEHEDKKEFFIKELAEGIGQIAAAFWPKPVIVRFSDFKTNEYSQLLGGDLFEPKEENPMLGWRGASRYYHSDFKPAFLMEIRAIKRVRDVFGLNNIQVMVPFCRTVEEGKEVVKIIKGAGLRGVKIYVMAEIPSNVLLAEEFLEVFDGISIGSNDLTQLVLGIDRDNAGLQKIGDERNEAVKKMVKEVIKVCQKKKKYCGICGQAPSDFPNFAKFLVNEGIESISLNPDSVLKTLRKLSGV